MKADKNKYREPEHEASQHLRHIVLYQPYESTQGWYVPTIM